MRRENFLGTDKSRSLCVCVTFATIAGLKQSESHSLKRPQILLLDEALGRVSELEASLA